MAQSPSHITRTCGAQHHNDGLVSLAGKVSAACGATAMQLDQQQEDHCPNHPCSGC